MAGDRGDALEAGIAERPELIEEGLEHDMRRQRGKPRIDAAHHLLQPRRVIAGLVDLVGHGRRHDAAEAAGGFLAEVARLDGVEPERRDVAMRLAQAERQVDDRKMP